MKKILLLIILLISFVSISTPTFAILQKDEQCRELDGSLRRDLAGNLEKCDANQKLVCKFKEKLINSPGQPDRFTCQEDAVASVIGEFSPPDITSKLGFGAGGISTFLSNVVNLIYVAATIIFVFMVIISGVQWILSAGDKEAVGNARKRLTYAIIGIVLLALAFVIIRIIGQITGFEFFVGQNTPLPTPEPTPYFPRGGRPVP